MILLNFLKKYKKVIMVLAAISFGLSAVVSGGVYLFLSRSKTYTASVNFRFTNKSAEDGYAFDGTQLDFYEIKGAEILDNAIQKFDGDITVDELSAGLSVETVIPKEEQDKIDSALKNGKEYEYHPIEFKATLTTDNPETAWIMTCIADSYYEYYGKTHVTKQRLFALPNLDGYDYLEKADLLRTAMLNAQNFLTEANSSYPDLRSSVNGYLYSDILAEYEFLYKNDLSELYEKIFSHKASKNPELLVQNYEKKIVANDIKSADTEVALNQAQSLIVSYSEKNKASGLVEDGYGDRPIDENHLNIIEDVYENETNPTATYDALFKTFNSNMDTIAFNNIDNDYYKYVISTFDEATVLTDQATIVDLEKEIDRIDRKVRELYKLTQELKRENDSISASSVLKQLNTPYAESSARVKLYTAIAFVAVNIMVLIVVPLLWALKNNIEKYIRENYLVY